MPESPADLLRRLKKPGILLRLDGSSEVFYIDEDALDLYRLPPCFQAGGQADPAMFKGEDIPKPVLQAGVQQNKDFMTGDELQRELNKASLFRRTNLLNAFYCEDGPFIHGSDDSGKIELASGVGKGHKPLTRFPSL